jgi:hypothetical protein
MAAIRGDRLTPAGGTRNALELQQSSASGQGATVPGEQTAIPRAAAERWFVCASGSQLHFTYADAGNNTLER